MLKKSRGFTLIEILIAMAVSAVVVTVAYSMIMVSTMSVRETEEDVSSRHEIRFLQETMLHDFQYLESFTVNGSSSYTVKLSDTSTVTYVLEAGTVKRNVSGELSALSLFSNVSAFEIVESGAASKQYAVTVQSGDATQGFQISNRRRTGVKKWTPNYPVPPSVIQGTSLIYINLTSGYVVPLKDSEGTPLGNLAGSSAYVSKILIRQISEKSVINIELYIKNDGVDTLVNTITFSDIAVFNNSGGSGTGSPVIYIDGISSGGSKSVSVVNLRNHGGAATAAINVQTNIGSNNLKKYNDSIVLYWQ